MPRTSTPRGDVAKERILQHAVQIFSQRGFDGFTTRELSAKAKVNIAAINYYFGHKQGLYDAAVVDVHRRLKERGEQIFAAEVAPLLFERPAGKPPTLDAQLLEVIVRRVYQGGRQESAGVRLLVRQVLDAGHLPSQVEPQHFLPGSEMAIGVFASALGVSPERARTNLVAFNFLLSRYLVQDERSLMSALGATSLEEAERQIIETLVGTLLGR